MAKKTENQFTLPTTEAEARDRLSHLGGIIRDAEPLVAQLKRLQAAGEILQAAAAEAAFINEHLDGIRAADDDRAVREYEITDITLVGDARNGGMPSFTVHGTHRGCPIQQPLHSQNRIFLTAVSRHAELIPAAVLRRDPENPFNALMKHYADHARGYCNG
ncbi:MULTISPECIES: hypothetical protein [unclassified Caballeronia]|uniref:hypothetical protein n=1 Tax=unclassified Caballeronia TaxID=2646786 RepID=UPI0028544E84|nr:MULTISPECIES: hypothetical protein [unclassified Caballeronia]MDR5771798.1 hypothetical protein [Caballeronia sp. LZ002]MDR5847233.1 hypothetical protein [Caballeronia sp. LZ003]